MNRNSDPDELAAHHQCQRSVVWRTEPDGMVTFTLRLPPLVAGMLIASLTTWVMTRRPTASERAQGASADAFGSLAQQRADAVEALVSEGAGTVESEIVLHVRGDGCTLDDGTPVPGTVIENIAPRSFIRALIHDAEANPINASGRQRHPTTRQKRVVKERDRACRDCGRTDLPEYDHTPPFETSRQTLIEDLELRCAPCHRRRHRNDREHLAPN